MSFFTEQLGRLQKTAQQAQRNRLEVEVSAHVLVAEIERCWGTHAAVRFGVAGAIDFTPNRVGALTDDLKCEFLVDLEFRGENAEVWNVRFPFIAMLTRTGLSMAMKDSSEHRVWAARPTSFHPLIAELESATDSWICALERNVQPK